VLATYSSGQYSGKPAITSNNFGKGKAIYIGPDLHPQDLSRVLGTLAADSGVHRTIDVPAGLELTVRKSGSRRWVCLLNHTRQQATVTLPTSFKDAMTGQTRSGAIEIPGYGVLILENS
jgi:beta-galactosidase